MLELLLADDFFFFIPAAVLLMRPLLFEYLAVFHYEVHFLQIFNVGQWIARDGHNIGKSPGRDHADIALHLQAVPPRVKLLP